MNKIEVSQRAREKAWAVRPECYCEQDRKKWMAGAYDHVRIIQAFARFERDILATRTAATSVAVEMVAELQLSAFLAGRGSIRTKANGNTHESSPGPTMDDYRRMARFALAEGQVDATPVAWHSPLGSLIEARQIARQAYKDIEREKAINGHVPGNPYDVALAALNSTLGCLAELVNHPPATDVAALVEAAKETNAALERDGDPAFAHLILANKAALAPFTKGQNDE